MSRNGPDPIPVVLLGRLAVSAAAQGCGLGRDLLADALRKATLVSETLGARALVTEAIDANAGRFYEQMGLWRSSARTNLFAVRLDRGRPRD